MLYGGAEFAAHDFALVDGLEFKGPPSWHDALKFAFKVLLIFVQVVLAEPGQVGANLADIGEAESTRLILQRANRLVIDQGLQKDTHFFQRTRICLCGGIS